MEPAAPAIETVETSEPVRAPDRMLRIALWVALALTVLFGFAAPAEYALAKSRTVVSHTIAAKDWQKSDGFAYYGPVPGIKADSDADNFASRSPYIMLENGVPLPGGPHAMHQDIKVIGQGRYSHWDDGFFVSASDNSDPRTNGRAYMARKTVPLHPEMAYVYTGGFGVSALASFVLFVWFAIQTRRRGWVAAPLLVMNIVAVLMAIWFFAGVEQRVPLDTQRAEGGSGFMRFIPAPDLAAWSDDNEHATRSDVHVFENGVELGPYHSMHSEVIGKGQGRVSHWQGFVGLSASDNTDVRTNGRTYEARRSLQPPLWLCALTALGWVFALLLTIRWRVGTLRQAKIEDAEAMLKASGFKTIAITAGAAWVIGVFANSAANADAAGAILDTARKTEQWVVAIIAAFGAAAVLAWRNWTGLAGGAVRFAGSALCVIGLLYIILDQTYGLHDMTPAIMIVFVVALGAAIGARYGLPQVRAEAMARVDRMLLTPEKRVLLAVVVCCVLTLIQIAPEVVRYWDQSGWIDSDVYDTMAHNIAIGAAPAGDSMYPPVYQYGLAALYWTFGHFFFIQQLANMVLALATTLFLMGAAWLLFRNLFVVWLAGLFAAHLEYLHHATWYTQIEGWYVPIFSLSLLALAWYLRRPVLARALALGVAAGLVLATRQQGLLYAGGLGAAALFVAGLTWRDRAVHIAAFGVLLLGIGLLPWSVRNLVVEGRFSPSSTQAIEALALYNDPRVPLHGIRYWEAGPVVAEWEKKYPDVNERHKAQQAYFTDRVVHHLDYFIEAAPWRAATFYGFLPTDVLNGGGSIDKFWANPWPTLQYVFDLWGPLLASFLGLAFAFRQRNAWLLAMLIPANVAVGLTVGSAEPRLCYPVLGLNMLLGLAMIAPFAPRDQLAGVAAAATSQRRTNWVAIAGAAVLGVLTARAVSGQPNLYRPIRDATYTFTPNVTIDGTLPYVISGAGVNVGGKNVPELEVGKRYRIQLTLQNSQFPPRWGQIDTVDPGLKRDKTVTYYLTGALTAGGVLIRLDGVHTLAPLREGMTIMGEIVVDNVTTVFATSPKFNWARLDKAIVINTPR